MQLLLFLTLLREMLTACPFALGEGNSDSNQLVTNGP